LEYCTGWIEEKNPRDVQRFELLFREYRGTSTIRMCDLFHESEFILSFRNYMKGYPMRSSQNMIFSLL